MGKMIDKGREKDIKKRSAKKERQLFPERVRLRRLKYELLHQERSLLRRAKKRAKERGTVFSLAENDIVIPAICPVLGIPLFKGTGKLCANSPSLDEIIPGVGYVRGNIQIISAKANTMKHNATPAELLKFSEWVIKSYA